MSIIPSFVHPKLLEGDSSYVLYLVLCFNYVGITYVIAVLLFVDIVFLFRETGS